jgi:DNA-binding FadR family transcriptional regulator
VQRVLKAYEQVADQLRHFMMSGDLPPGQRLPSETALATQFGVSRATVREALRVLSSQNLIRTTKGQGGGSFVTQPAVDHISKLMSANINLLTQSDRVTLHDLIEARELIEIPAARLAARRRTPHFVELLRREIPAKPATMTTDRQFLHNKSFHSALLLASGNPLLAIAAEPVFSVLQTHLQRSILGPEYHQRINNDHRAIAAAVEAGDEDAVAEQMLDHLAYLRPKYEASWSSTQRSGLLEMHGHPAARADV